MSTVSRVSTGTLAGGRLEELFRAYFNNRMMILLMMIEHPEISRNSISVERAKFFLEDLYHHFLPPQAASKYRHAFEWLFRFMDTFPFVTPKQIYQAIRMVGLVYEVFGLELPKRIEAVRLEKEGMGGKKRNAQRKASG